LCRCRMHPKGTVNGFVLPRTHGRRFAGYCVVIHVDGYKDLEIAEWIEA
jgi:hypothetical protein